MTKPVFDLPEKWRHSPYYFVMMVEEGFKVMGGTQSECECIRTILPENSNVVSRELFLEAVDIAGI